MVNRDPDSSGAFEGLTLALAARGRWRDAVEAAEEALELQERLPATTEAALALALAKLDETDRAREHLQAVESDIHTPGAWIDIPYFAGLAYRELGETKRSDELFRRAIDRWPKHPWSQKMREMM
jgi:tetratricopeptide (TPR) repeat protein